jgi:KRAB domain-containing zinc finger protein
MRAKRKSPSGSLYYCDICGFQDVTEKEDLEYHMLSHMRSVEQSFFCEYCSKEFSRKHLLNRHIKLKHTEKQRTHKCPTCNKSFFTISTLKKHVESHGTKHMPCEFCGKLFSCMNNLRTHLYYHAEPKFICEIENCGKKFYMRKLLKAHLNVRQNFSCQNDVLITSKIFVPGA